MADEYVLPIGIDGTALADGVQEGINQLNKLRAAAKDATEGMSKNVEAATEATEQMSQTTMQAVQAAKQKAAADEAAAQAAQKVTAATKAQTTATETSTTATKSNTISQTASGTAVTTSAAKTTVLATAQKAYTAATEQAIVATKAFIASLVSTGIGAVIVALGALIAQLFTSADATDAAAEAMDRYNKTLEYSNELFNESAKKVKNDTAIAVERAKQQGASENELYNIRVKGTNQLLVLAQQEKAIREDKLAEAKKDSETTQEQLQEYQDKVRESTIKVNDIIRQGNLDAEKERTRRVEQQKKEQETAAKNAERAARQSKTERDKAAREQEQAEAKQQRIDQEYRSLSVDFAQKSAQAKVDAMHDGLQKELAAENNAYEKQKATIQLQVDNFKGSEEQRAKLQQAANKLIEDQTQTHAAKITAITIAGLAQQEIELQKYNETVSKLYEDDKGAAIAAINQKYIQIRANMKEQGKLTSDLDLQITEANAKEIKNATTKIDLDKLEKEEQLAEANAELIKKSGLDEKSLKELSEQAKLQVTLEYAEKRLKILEAAGGKENDLAIAQTKKLIQDVKQEISEATKASPLEGFLMKSFGLTKEQSKAVETQLKSMFKNVASIFGSIGDLYQQQADAKQKQVDALSDQIDEVQSQLDKELELQKDGYANNVEAKQEEVDKLKQQRAEDQKDLEEIQKKREAAQKAQIIADSLLQINNLVTAASEIFKAFSAIPFVGVPLAIAAIGTMFGAFTLAKISALKSVNSDSSTSSYAKGGRAKGKRHSEGGNKYVSADGHDQDIIEIEKDEWVINRKSSDKYNSLLHAINQDDIAEMSTRQLENLLINTGVRLPDDEVRKTLILQKQVENQKYSPKYGKDNYLKSIDAGIRQLNSKGKDGEEIIDMGDYILVKSPNRSRKIFKSK